MKLQKKKKDSTNLSASAVSGSTQTYASLSQFPEIRRPKFADTLKFPENLTSLTSINISELHGKYTQMYAYANQEVTRANIVILRLETRQTRRRNEIFRQSPALNSQERWKRDAILEEDYQMERINILVAHEKQKMQIAQMFAQNFDKYLVALSRELSRKMSEQGMRS